MHRSYLEHLMVLVHMIKINIYDLILARRIILVIESPIYCAKIFLQIGSNDVFRFWCNYACARPL